MHDGLPIARRFSAAMRRFGPFEPAPLLAVAVSGGADSLALAVLAEHWVRPRGGSVIGLVVDHALRTASRSEADLTVERLGRRGIPARLLLIDGLARGSGLAARARTERYRVLIEACAALGCLHLLLGHHGADQGETLMMRALGNSGSAGLAGMPGLSERPTVRLLRPLLSMSPADLRDLLRAEGLAWVEDPSNRDPTALRARLRMAGAAEPVLADAALTAGRARAAAEERAGRALAAHVSVHPEGFARLSPGPVHPDALAALIQMLAGAPFPPSPAAVARLAAEPRAATLAGIRMMPAGRLGAGWLLLREEAAMQPDTAAHDGAVWDRRFRLLGPAPPGARLGALGKDAPRFRARTGLPAAILRTLPTVREGLKLVAIPHLGYYANACACPNVLFCPPQPMARTPFRTGFPSREGCG